MTALGNSSHWHFCFERLQPACSRSWLRLVGVDSAIIWVPVQWLSYAGTCCFLPKRSQMVPLRDQVVDLLLILSGQLLANER